MRKIPNTLLKELLEDSFMKKCVHTNSQNVTFEHALIFKKRQINERWAIIPCAPEYNIGAVGKVKRFNQFVAYWRLFLSDPIYFDEQVEKYDINPREFVKLNFEFSLNDYPCLRDRLFKYRIKKYPKYDFYSEIRENLFERLKK